MAKRLLILITLTAAALLLYASTRPDTFRIERSAVINAPAHKIFAYIDDFHRWSSWSPWEKADPQLKRTYSGSDRGLGAVYEWSGNKDVGAGRMEITASNPPSNVGIQIDFLTPFEAHNQVEFKLEPLNGATRVTHAMHGPQPFVAKIMSLVFNMDTMVGQKFEEGLATLKSLAEK